MRSWLLRIFRMMRTAVEHYPGEDTDRDLDANSLTCYTTSKTVALRGSCGPTAASSPTYSKEMVNHNGGYAREIENETPICTVVGHPR